MICFIWLDEWNGDGNHVMEGIMGVSFLGNTLFYVYEHEILSNGNGYNRKSNILFCFIIFNGI